MGSRVSRSILAIFVLAVLALMGANAEPPSAVSLRTVVRVIDGDTIALDGGETVRLIGVDAPEMTDLRPAFRGYARAGMAYLDGILHKRKVRLEYDRNTKDDYGRTLAYLYLPDGTFVNKRIIEAGYAHAYLRFAPKYSSALHEAERQACQKVAGLWRFGKKGEEPFGDAKSTRAKRGKIIVYVTAAGTKYHRASCSHLRGGKIPLPLSEARKRYTPCRICKPPQ